MTNNDLIFSNTASLDFRDALRLIHTLLDCDCRFRDPSIHPDCRHDLRQRDMRNLLIDRTDIDLDSDAAELLRDLLTTMLDSPYARHDLSMMMLDFSLCPMHAIDYAICFDDDHPDCAAIRATFPRHDT